MIEKYVLITIPIHYQPIGHENFERSSSLDYIISSAVCVMNTNMKIVSDENDGKTSEKSHVVHPLRRFHSENASNVCGPHYAEGI